MSINLNQGNTPTPQQSGNTVPKNTYPPSVPIHTALEVSRELDGVNDTGIVGEILTLGTQHVGETNRFFALNKFKTGSLLDENNGAVSSSANLLGDNGAKVLSEDDMYVAGDPIVGGKRNNYVPIPVTPTPGFYTMFEDGGVNGGSKVTINSHVEKINPEGNVALTEYGFILQDDKGKKTKATLSGGEFLIEDASGKTRKLLPPNDVYTIGNPSDPTARFYYADIPGAGENGKPEKRLVMDYFEKPSEASVKAMVAKGIPQAQAEQLRSKSSMNFGFRIPDGVNTFASSEGVGAGNKIKTAGNGVKTYYDAHFLEGKSAVVKATNYDYHPAPPPPPPPANDHPPEPPPPPPPANDHPPAPPPPPPPANDHPPEPPPPPPGNDYPPALPPKDYPVEQARIWGDPHIVDADGGKYDFQETGIYNILKDSNIAVNSQMEKFREDKNGNDITVNTKAGITVGNQTILVNADGTTTMGNRSNSETTALKSGETKDLGGGNSVSRTNDIVTINTPEYKIEVLANKGSSNKYLDIDIYSKAGGVMSDGVAPSGLLGETFDADKTAQNKPKNSAASYRESTLLTPVFQATQANNANNTQQDTQKDINDKPLLEETGKKASLSSGETTTTPPAQKEKDATILPPTKKRPPVRTGNPFQALQEMMNQLLQLISKLFRGY